jgi:hypothetical protein
MKNILIAIIAIQFSYSQNTFPTNGNVGIGTLLPISTLDVIGNGLFRGSITSSIPDNTGGRINLINDTKLSNGIGQRWTIYNMTGVYGNSLQFWAYDNLGCVPGGMCTNRFTIMDNGNVGIGINSPTQKLDVNGNINMAGVSGRRLFMGGAGGSTFGIAYDSNNPNYGIFYTEGEPDYVSISPNGNATAGIMNILGNRKVGIGTSSPTEILEIYNSDTTPGTISLKSSRNDFGYVDVGRISAKQASVEVSRIGMPRAGGTNTGYLTFWTKSDNAADLSEKMRISENGNVGIGTTNPTSKLTVAGNISSREVKVTVDAGADFVFEKEYNLPSLDSVDKYIKENKHLPEIASAQEMQKEGINLSEMNIKLLQKIEELTLYTIEQNKKLEKQNKEIDIHNRTLEIQNKVLENQQKLIGTLAERLSRLERK